MHLGGEREKKKLSDHCTSPLTTVGQLHLYSRNQPD